MMLINKFSLLFFSLKKQNIKKKLKVGGGGGGQSWFHSLELENQLWQTDVCFVIFTIFFKVILLMKTKGDQLQHVEDYCQVLRG